MTTSYFYPNPGIAWFLRGNTNDTANAFFCFLLHASQMFPFEFQRLARDRILKNELLPFFSNF